MTTTPYVRVQASVSGGALQSGGLTVSSTDSVALSLESTIGIQSCLWEVYDSPLGATPPPGWALDVAGGRWYVTTLAPHRPPEIDFAGQPWGKYLLRATGNNGVEGGRVVVQPADGTTMRDESTAFSIESPNGFEDIAALEDDQFYPTKKWIGAYQRNLRTWSAVLMPGATEAGQIPVWSGSWGVSSELLVVPGGDISVRTSTIRWESGYSPFLSQDVAASGNGSWFTIQAQSADAGRGGDLNLFAGSGSSGGGDALIGGGAGTAGAGGDVILFAAGGAASGSILEYVGGSPSAGGTLMRSVSEDGHRFHGDVLFEGATRWSPDSFGINLYIPPGTGVGASFLAQGQQSTDDDGGMARLHGGTGAIDGGTVELGAGSGGSGVGGNFRTWTGDGGSGPGVHQEYVGHPNGGGVLMRTVSEDGHDFHGKPLRNFKDFEVPVTFIGTGSSWVQIWVSSLYELIPAANRTRRVGIGVSLRPSTSDDVDVLELSFNIARGNGTFRFADVRNEIAGSSGATISGTLSGVFNAASLNWRLRYEGSDDTARLEVQQDASLDLGVGVRLWWTEGFGG